MVLGLTRGGDLYTYGGGAGVQVEAVLGSSILGFLYNKVISSGSIFR